MATATFHDFYLRHRVPCATAFTFIFSNDLFFKELESHAVLFQTCSLSSAADKRGGSMKLGE